ncbi:MAG: LCP family protein [Acidimicrobiales bacterium]
MPNSPSSRHVANADRLAALGDAVAARSGGPRHVRKTRRSPKRIILLSLAGVVVLVVAAVAADYFYLNSLVTRVNVPTEVQTYNDTENILLVGSTTRCGLKHQNAAYGTCAQGVTGVNSDVVMVLHLNWTTNRVAILSIPRDLFVPNARTTGANKIDAALYQGPAQLVSAVQDDFGIPINHYIELNFDTFASVVNVLGGIHMYFPMPVFDAYSGLNVRTTGCLHLNGYRALQVVRARHLQYQPTGVGFSHTLWPQEGLSDLARIRRDHEFLRVLSAAVKARGIANPVTDQALATAVAPYLTVDSAFSVSHMLNMAEHFHSTPVAGVPQLTVPVVLVETGSYLYKGYYYGDVEFPIEPGISSVIDQFLGLTASTNTMDGKPLPSPSAVTVSVVNGTGVSRQAQVVAEGLHRYGFAISTLSSATPWGKRTETVVYHVNDTAASLAAAQAVLHTISGPAVMARGPVTPGSQVTVVTGTDISVMRVPTRATTTTTVTKRHHGATTTTAPTTQVTVVDPTAVKRDTSLSAPTAVTQALQPWDPRSCGPHGKPGP